MSRDEGLSLLNKANHVHFASCSLEGEPILRALHGVIVDGYLMYHAAPVGEKIELLGQRAVVSYEEVIASIPSYWVDPERACPATTLYRSVQIHGVVEAEENPEIKARALTALMQKFQPEGGYQPISNEDKFYRKAVQGVMVGKLSLETMDAKHKLAQNRNAAERKQILERLWQRGEKNDLLAIELILAACPDTPRPIFLTAPAGVSLCVCPNESDANEAAELLKDTYWNDRFGTPVLREAHLGSQAWIVAHDEKKKVIASARAITDTTKRAWIFDVIVAPEWRHRQVGDAVMRTLLDHPAMRSVALTHLGTRDAQGFYSRMGFVDVKTLPPRAYSTTEMALSRLKAIPDPAP
ncbi:MAG: GNAT family N-acetyltransferase [Polyangiaceae bacterium]